MNEFSDEIWQNIKNIANRLQAIRTLMKTFDEQINSPCYNNELKPIREQLQAEFDENLQVLINLLEADDA